MPIGLIAVLYLIGGLAVREVAYLGIKHHQDKAGIVQKAPPMNVAPGIENK